MAGLSEVPGEVFEAVKFPSCCPRSIAQQADAHIPTFCVASFENHARLWGLRHLVCSCGSERLLFSPPIEATGGSSTAISMKRLAKQEMHG